MSKTDKYPLYYSPRWVIAFMGYGKDHETREYLLWQAQGKEIGRTVRRYSNMIFMLHRGDNPKLIIFTTRGPF